MIIKHRYIKEINKNIEFDIDKLGGKCEGLLKALKLGYNIPEGFIITTDLFIKHITESIEISWKEIEDYSNLPVPLKEIQEKILKYPLPMSVSIAIEAYLGVINAPHGFAIRSSATSEDSKYFSMAGIYKSCLNISSFEEIIISMKKVWASIFTKKSFYYLKSMNIEKLPKMAILIEKMISPKVSGVAFSSNPDSGNFNEIIINSVNGMCTGMVEGISDYDTYTIIKKNEERLVSGHHNIREKRVFVDSDGMMKKLEQKKSVLSLMNLIELGNIFVTLENNSLFPQDIEWAIENNNIYILQSRPITGLYTHYIDNKNSENNIFLYLKSFFNKQTSSIPPLIQSIILSGMGNYLKKVCEFEKIEIFFISAWTYFKIPILEDNKIESNNFYEKLDMIIKKFTLENRKIESSIFDFLPKLKNPFKTIIKRRENHIDKELLKTIREYSTSFVFLKPDLSNLKIHIDFLFSIFDEEFKYVGEKNITFSKFNSSALILNKNLTNLLNEITFLKEKINFIGEDIIFLKLDELVNISKENLDIFSKLILRRKCELNFYKSIPIPPNVIENSEEVVTADSDFPILKGRGITGGIIMGKIHLFDGKIEDVPDGSILVSKYATTDCAELFDKITGFLVEDGKTLTHSIILVREYKIPTVVGLNKITSILKNGDEIILDGKIGYIKLLGNYSKKNYST